eukprot:scaffold7.g3640.t1
MGGACCKPVELEERDSQFGSNQVKSWRRPRWKSETPMTQEELERQREVFWDTEPHYGGSREIWDALRAACEADDVTAKVIIETAGVIVASEDMRICYDTKGAKYDLPKYVLAPPTNLIKPRRSSTGRSGSSGGEGSAKGGAAAAAGQQNIQLPAVAG